MPQLSKEKKIASNIKSLTIFFFLAKINNKRIQCSLVSRKYDLVLTEKTKGVV